MLIKRKNKISLNNFKDLDIPYSQEDIDSWLKKENVISFSVIDENKNLGFIILEKTDISIIEILFIYIKKEERNKKLAEKLLKAVINIIKSDIKEIFLEVNENNIQAIKLYEKLNFNKISERKRYYKDDSTAFIYKLDLRS